MNDQAKDSKVIDIANKTIAFGLMPVTPSLDEATSVNDGEQSNHGTETSKKLYTPTLEEREIIKQLLGEDDKFIDSCDITMMEDGNISIRTCRRSWMTLAGREWCINLKTKECRHTSMS